jgi:hypothetical protein
MIAIMVVIITHWRSSAALVFDCRKVHWATHAADDDNGDDVHVYVYLN